jgi:xanthine phosphoribosyltransferase
VKVLKEKILKYGRVYPGNILKVDSFLNHQIDMRLITEMGGEFARRYSGCGVNKVLTIEASGIILAGVVACEMCLPMLFAKKAPTKNISDDVYTTSVMSYTHGRVYDIFVSKEFLLSTDRVLIIDDFLANGVAIEGLSELIRQAGATLVGCGIAIEKGFQDGGKRLRGKGIRIESLVTVDGMTDNALTFAE